MVSKVMKLSKKQFCLSKNFLIVVFAGVGLFLIFFLSTSLYIGHGVKNVCIERTTEYKKDCVDSLIDLLNDESKNFGEKNTAIWALGQIGDKKALTPLLSLYTGIIPDKEPWDGTISQYELKKAINLLSGSVNISALVWRVFYSL